MPIIVLRMLHNPMIMLVMVVLTVQTSYGSSLDLDRKIGMNQLGLY